MNRELAEQLFWGPWQEGLVDEALEEFLDSDLCARNYGNFLSIDFAIEGERTLVDLMLERHGGTAIRGAEQQYLEALRDSYIGLYEVVGLEPEVSFRLRNACFDEEDAILDDAFLASEFHVGDLVAMRLMANPSGKRVSEGDLYLFPIESGPTVGDPLEAERRAFEEEGKSDPAAYLKRTGFRFNWLWMELLLLGRETPSQYPHSRARLTDYLDGGELTPRIPAESRRLGFYLGRIAASASRFGPDEEVSTSIECRRRPRNVPCDGWLMAVIDKDDDCVHWECPGCGDTGTIEDWRGTPFDLSIELPVPDGGVRTLTIGLEDQRRLYRLPHLSAPALTLLASGDWDGRAGFDLEGTQDEFVALAQCVERELVQGELSQAGERSLENLRDAFRRTAVVAPDRTSDAPTGDVPGNLVLAPHPRPLPTNTEADGGHVLHVRLLDVEPPVWRRIELPSRTPLSLLHHVLVEAVGWDDTHLHLFRKEGDVFAPPGTLDGKRTEDSRTTLLGRLLPRAGDQLLWEYDFGDGWRHEVRVDSITPDRPTGVRLLAGEGACPPEDCGGPFGYQRLVEILQDPEHPEHVELRDWCGDEFDPTRFDRERVQVRLQALTEHVDGS